MTQASIKGIRSKDMQKLFACAAEGLGKAYDAEGCKPFNGEAASLEEFNVDAGKCMKEKGKSSVEDEIWKACLAVAGPAE